MSPLQKIYNSYHNSKLRKFYVKFLKNIFLAKVDEKTENFENHYKRMSIFVLEIEKMYEKLFLKKFIIDEEDLNLDFDFKKNI